MKSTTTTDRSEDGALVKYSGHASRSHTTTIHEHRAPTDASVTLLKEMEAAAERKLVESVHVGNAVFECVVHQQYDCMSDCMKMRAIFKLNGRQEVVDHEWRSRSRDRHPDEIDAWQALRDKVAIVIATRMIGAAFLGTSRIKI